MIDDRGPRPIHHPGTASRVFGDEAVILTPAQNGVTMLDEVGSRIWELADGTRTVADIAARLAGEYDVGSDQAEESITRFVELLVDKDLLAWR